MLVFITWIARVIYLFIAYQTFDAFNDLHITTLRIAINSIDNSLQAHIQTSVMNPANLLQES